jgi:hypothetical protein
MAATQPGAYAAACATPDTPLYPDLVSLVGLDLLAGSGARVGTEMIGKPMTGAEPRQPAVELEVAVQAGEMRFREPSDVRTQAAGMTHVARDSQRDGIPRRARPDVSYSDVRVSFRIAAWLDEPGERGEA